MNHDDRMIAAKLKQRRAELKMSVADVVAALNDRGIDVAQKTVFGWENAVSRPNIIAFMALCRIYEITDILSYFDSNS